MRDFLLYLLQNLLVLDLLILMIWILDKCRKWSIGHLWRKWLWFFICLRMLFPVEIHLQDFHESWNGVQLVLEVETEAIPQEAAEQAEQIQDLQINRDLVQGTRWPQTENQLADSLVENESSETSPAIQNKPAFPEMIRKNWELILLGIWFAGFAVLLFYHIFQYCFLKEFFFEDAKPCCGKETDALLKKLCQQYRIRQTPKVLEKEDAVTPMTFGYFKQKLVVPAFAYEPMELSLVLQHELVHIKYLDSWYKALLMLLCDLYWFNPMFWLMKRLAFQDVEYVCDERVAKVLTAEEKRSYGETIIKTVSANFGREVPSAVQFAVEKRQLKSRLQNLIVFRNWYKGILPLSASVFFAVVLLAGITVSIKEIPVQAEEGKDKTAESMQEASEETGMSVSWGEEDAIAATCYTDDLQALNLQKDAESSYITERFTGFNHYYIDEKGTLWGTGGNDMWQLGIPKESDVHNLEHSYTEPVKIAEHVIHVDASVNSVFVIWLTEEGNLYGLGANTYGVLRMPMAENEMLNPWSNLASEPQLLMENVVYASAGRESVSVLTKDGKVWWWGLFQATTGTSAPEKIHSQKPLLMMEHARYTVCGFDTAAAIDEDNNLWLWGCNVWGQCGTDGKDGKDYLIEPYMAEADVEMVWPDFLSSRQNIFDVDAWMHMNPYNDSATGCIYSYTTFIRKTDGNYYACGIDLGHDTKSVGYYGDLFIENTDNPENYIRNYSTDFLLIDVKENPR